MRLTPKKIAATIATLVMASSVGCTTMSKSMEGTSAMFEKLPFVGSKDDVPEPYPNPVKLATTWSPDTLTQIGKTPTRGFGGRVFFYNEKSEAVPVDGTLIVHAFDESMKGEKGGVKRFEFTPEQFTKKFSQTDMGASYSFWIPWDAVGGNQKEISMVTSFKTVEGKLVQGTPAKILLPGLTESRSKQLAQRFAPGYEQWKIAQAGNTRAPSGLTTTTIQRRGNSLPNSALDAGNPDLGSPMIATGPNTPSVNVRLASQPGKASFLPASAELPAKR